MKYRLLIRYRRSVLVFGFAVVCLLSITVHGQSTEIAISTGGNFVSNGNLKMGTTWAVQGSIAHRFFRSSGLETGRFQVYGELPIAVGKETGVAHIPSRPFQIDPPLSPRIASIFVTPGIKMKFNVPLLSPYLTVGIGVGHFYTAGGPTENRPVISYGTGLDFNLRTHFGLGGEVRDYNSPVPKIAIAGSGRQHNLFVTGGVVFRF